MAKILTILIVLCSVSLAGAADWAIVFDVGNGIDDGYLDDATGSNYVNVDLFRVRNGIVGGDGRVQRGIIRFLAINDSIDGSLTIDSAVFIGYISADGDTATNHYIYFYDVAEYWVNSGGSTTEGSPDWSARRQYAGSARTDWTNGGCGTPTSSTGNLVAEDDSIEVLGTGTFYARIDTSYIRLMSEISTAADSTIGGFLLRGNDSYDGVLDVTFSSSDNATAGQRPTLTVYVSDGISESTSAASRRRKIGLTQ